MTAIDTLRREFPGERVWHEYAKAVSGNLDTRLAPAVFDGIDLETAQVIGVLVGDHASAWWTSSVKGLDGLTPAQAVGQVTDGLMIIQSLLMRFP